MTKGNSENNKADWLGNSVFVAGTDTDIGKTHVALRLMREVREQGLSVAGYKPVSAGCDLLDGRWKNADALALQQASSIELDYDLINPYAFELPIAPHIAAAQQGVEMTLEKISENYQAIQQQVDVVVVEGAGGCMVPLNSRQTLLDAAAALQLPLVLVVGMRLGCINHALLSVEAIRAKGLRLQQLVFNHYSPRASAQDAEIIATIRGFAGCDSSREITYQVD